MIATFVAYNLIFDDTPVTNSDYIIRLLKEYSPFDLVVRLTSLLNYILKPEINKNEQFQVAFALADEKTHLKILELYQDKKFSVFFFRGQIETLIDIIIENSNQFESYETAASINNEDLLKSLLIASDIWGDHTYKAFRAEGLDPLLNALSFRKGIESSNSANEYYFYVGKSYIIYNEIMNKQFTDFNELFKKNIGIDIESYFQCYLLFLVFFEVDDRFKNGIFSKDFLAGLADKKSMQELLMKFSISMDRLFLEKSYCRTIDRFPFIELPNAYIIADYLRMLNSMAIGPLFILENRPDTWLSRYGKAIEIYVCKTINRMYPHSDQLVKRAYTEHNYNIGRNKYDVDSIIINLDSIVVIEIKNAIVNESAEDIDNPINYINFLNERYGITTDHKKGIGQLFRIISHYMDKKIEGIPSLNNIFPVLIVNDDLIASSLSNKYLSEAFFDLYTKERSESSESIKINGFRIFRLTIISVKELDILERTIIEYGFEKLLIDYISYNRTGNQSLTDFLVEKKIGRYHNTFLASIGYDLVEKMADTYFPEIIKNIRERKGSDT